MVSLAEDQYYKYDQEQQVAATMHQFSNMFREEYTLSFIQEKVPERGGT